MFGLSEAEWNEKIMIDVISTHHKKVELLIDRYRFVWTAGYIAGRVGNKEGDYE